MATKEELVRRILEKRLDAGEELQALYDLQESERTIHANALHPYQRPIVRNHGEAEGSQEDVPVRDLQELPQEDEAIGEQDEESGDEDEAPEEPQGGASPQAASGKAGRRRRGKKR